MSPCLMTSLVPWRSGKVRDDMLAELAVLAKLARLQIKLTSAKSHYVKRVFNLHYERVERAPQPRGRASR